VERSPRSRLLLGSRILRLLKPDVYKEMKVQTRGEFGGLGFVISMIEDKLTVGGLENTPAYKGGLRRATSSPRSTTTPPSAWSCRKAVDRMRASRAPSEHLVSHKGMNPKRRT